MTDGAVVHRVSMAEARPVFSTFVPGLPRPAGSKRAVPAYDRRAGRYVTKPTPAGLNRPVVRVLDDADSAGWRQAVAAGGIEARRELLTGPLSVEIAFMLPRPKSHFTAGGRLKPNARRWPAVRPDVLKLARAVEDALTGIVWADDAQIVDEHISKRYGVEPGVSVAVRRLAEG